LFAFLTLDRYEAVLIGNTPVSSLGRVQDVSPQQLVVYAAAVLAVALIGARYLKSAAGERPASAVQFSSGASGPSGRSVSAEVVVYVSGAVRRPGIVRLHEGDRVADAIDAAGGARRGADLGAVNLAARVADGQQVIVPARIRSGAGGGSSGPVSLSSATLEQLDALDGVGPGIAQKILDFRDQHGGFSSVDQLAEVPGIGEKRLESLRAQLQP
jgi:competence protein ComEA